MASRSEAHFHPPSSVQAKRLKVINNGWPGIESVETHWHHRVASPNSSAKASHIACDGWNGCPPGESHHNRCSDGASMSCSASARADKAAQAIRRCCRVAKAQEMPADIGSSAGGCGRTRLAESLLTGAAASVRCALTFSDRRGFMVVDSAERVSSIESRESPLSARVSSPSLVVVAVARAAPRWLGTNSCCRVDAPITPTVQRESGPRCLRPTT